MRRVTVGFLGWFGSRGLASIVFVLILGEQQTKTNTALEYFSRNLGAAATA